MRVLEDRSAPIPADLREMCREIFRLEDASGIIGWAGFQDTDLLSREGFVWFAPGPALTAGKVRKLLPLWREYAKKFRRVYAGCAPGTPGRFAEFFGLTLVGPLNKEYLLYGLRNDSHRV